MGFDEWDPHCVEAGEKPTSAGLLLIGQRLYFFDLQEIKFKIKTFSQLLQYVICKM